MAVVLGLHLAVAVLCAALGSRLGARVFAVGALAPLAAFAWLLTKTSDVTSGAVVTESLRWAASLSLVVPLRLDGLALLLALVISGIGAVVLLYSVGYFAERRAGLGLLSAVLVLFAGAMLALVLADNLLALYVAWELTTVCSFLLIGDIGRERIEREAALRALLVTTGTGFVMLLGLILLGGAAGTYRVSAVVANPPDSGLATAALVLILVGALGKSAQVPFHPWLPAAMVASTPVSAYLHAAAMVKAGVYLVARLAPAFAEAVPWGPVVLTVGLVSMVLGGWRALSQTDLKMLLAFGTIAQLGFLMVLLGAGTRTAALAGATMLLAHALFKSALFLVVGAIDHAAGTRDIRELSGVRRHAPVLALVAVLACASMVGLPPTVGYLGKEAALEAFVEPAPGGSWVLGGLVLGSTLTVAYTLRFLVGAFGDRTGVSTPGSTSGHGVPAGAWLPPAVVGLAGVVVGLVPTLVDTLVASYADGYPVEGTPYHLALWHGLKPPLLLSALSLVAGAALYLVHARVMAARDRLPTGPTALGAQDLVARWVATGSRAVTVHTQVGSLPAYLVVILGAVVLGPGLMLVLAVGVPVGAADLWDRPAQGALTAGIAAAVTGTVLTRRRLTSVLMLSAAGYLMALLFVLHGAPDLALVQVLVETLTLLIFVLVLRRMPRDHRLPQLRLRTGRSVIAVLVGCFAGAATLAMTARGTPSRSAQGYFDQAPQVGGPNVVNVILTEFRALDTLGEITVVAVAATGIASLVLVTGRLGGARPTDSAGPHPDVAADGSGGGPHGGPAKPDVEPDAEPDDEPAGRSEVPGR